MNNQNDNKNQMDKKTNGSMTSGQNQKAAVRNSHQQEDQIGNRSAQGVDPKMPRSNPNRSDASDFSQGNQRNSEKEDQYKNKGQNQNGNQSGTQATKQTRK